MILALLVFLPFGLPGQAYGQTDDPPAETTPDNEAAMRWWDALNPEQRLAALHGDEPTPEQTAAAENPYADLDMATKGLVNDAADAINGNVEFASVGAWWQSLDCRLKRVATGDGNTEDTASPYCAHYPGSGRTPLLGAEEKAPVDTVGQALLGRMDLGVYPSDSALAMRWWNALDAAQRVAALHGDAATLEPGQRAAAERMYGDLDPETKRLVHTTTAGIASTTRLSSVGAWWESLNCRQKRVATGDGNTDDPNSPYCAYYPGSGVTPLLGADEQAHVDTVGQAVLGLMDPGVYPPDIPPVMQWWDAFSPDQRVAALHGDTATPQQSTAARNVYADLDPGDQEVGQRRCRGSPRPGPIRQRRRLVGVPRLPPQARRYRQRQHRRSVQPLLRPLSRLRDVADTRRHGKTTRQRRRYGAAPALRPRRVSAGA